MRVAVLADTHVSSIKDLPRKIIDSLSTFDLIVHAGDLTTKEVLNGLKQLAEVKAVQGNMDSTELRATLPVKEILEIGNKRIGITHSSGGPWEIEDRARRIFDRDQVDVIIYGHSHQSQNKVTDNILFFNPGKATNSFGILTIEEEVRGEIISSKS
jgi:putative phosphoesterase